MKTQCILSEGARVETTPYATEHVLLLDDLKRNLSFNIISKSYFFIHNGQLS